MPVSLLITGYYRSPKLVAAVADVGLAAEVLWTRALDHCNEHGTDGYIGPGMPDVILGRPAKKVVAALVKHGAWHIAGDGRPGHLVHDFTEWNRTASELAAQTAAKSESRRRAGKAGAASRWGSRIDRPNADGKEEAAP